jgi:hypothetical protein
MVAHNPLHGSGRAALLHPALASGNNAKALPGIRMTHTSQWEPASYSALHLCPRYTGFLAAPPQYSPPDPSHGHAKVTDTDRIHRHRVVTHVPQNHRAHILAHFWNRRRYALLEFGFHFLKLTLPALAHRLPQHHKFALAGLCTAVREPEKVKGLRFSFASALSVLFCMPAKLDQARLLGVQFQPKALKPLHKLAQKLLPVLSALKSHNEVVDKPHHDHIPSGLYSSPLLDPQVKPIVQVNVGQKAAIYDKPIPCQAILPRFENSRNVEMIIWLAVTLSLFGIRNSVLTTS